MKGFGRSITAGAVTSTLALALASMLPASAWKNDDGNEEPRFGPWSAPVNLGSPVNSAFAEQFPTVSKDGLSLYFSCFNCPGNIGGADIWVSKRASANDPWGTPQNLGPNINTTYNDSGPALSSDEHELYFNSNRPGGFGNSDLYVSRRPNKRDDFGWQPAENLGSGVNTAASEAFAEFFEDEETGVITLYFQSNRLGGPGGTDIYASTLQADGTFGPAVLVVELSSPFEDLQPAIRRDGLEMFLASDRPGTSGNVDLWVSTRASTSDPWSNPVNLGPTVNSVFADGGPSLSFDGTQLYFHSPFRSGNAGGPMFDIWVSTRTKVKEQD